MSEPKFKTYRVIWEMEMDATNPVEAAQEAFKIMRAQPAYAASFEVIDENGHSRGIDLLSVQEEDYEEEDFEDEDGNVYVPVP